MNKIFLYVVEGTEFEGFDPWGENWKAAKALAISLHAPVYRYVINTKTEKMRYEVFCTGGVFLNADRIELDRIKIF